MLVVVAKEMGQSLYAVGNGCMKVNWMVGCECSKLVGDESWI